MFRQVLLWSPLKTRLIDSRRCPNGVTSEVGVGAQLQLQTVIRIRAQGSRLTRYDGPDGCGGLGGVESALPYPNRTLARDLNP